MATKTMGPVSAPLMTAPPVPEEAQGRPPEPDDIPEPAVPAAVLEPSAAEPPSPLPERFGAHEALLRGFCETLQSRMHSWMMDEHRQLAAGMDVTMTGIRDYAHKVLQCNEHAEYQLANALTKLATEGLPLLSPPYQARLQVETAAGYPMTLTITKSTAAALIEELGRLEPWLKQSGYKPGTVGEYA